MEPWRPIAVKNLQLSAIQEIGRAKCRSAALCRPFRTLRFLSNKHGVPPVCLPRSKPHRGQRNPWIRVCDLRSRQQTMAEHADTISAVRVPRPFSDPIFIPSSSFQISSCCLCKVRRMDRRTSFLQFHPFLGSIAAMLQRFYRIRLHSAGYRSLRDRHRGWP